MPEEYTNYKVTYTVEFTTVIRVPKGEDPRDEASEINIPEGLGGTYVQDTFEVTSIEPTDETATNA